MPTQAKKIAEIVGESTVDGKALAIKLAAMALVTAASIAATHIVIKQISKGREA